MTLGGSGNGRHAEGRNVWRHIHIMPHAKKSKQRQEVARESSRGILSDNSPNLVVSTRDIDQVSAEHNLNAISPTLATALAKDEGIALKAAITPLLNGGKATDPTMQNFG